MKNHLVIIIFLVFLNPAKLISQNQPNEIEIKKSGNYYWGQAYHADTNQAKNSARDDLIYRISNQISNVTTPNTKSDVMLKYIKYIYKPVEELTKAIAYVSKEDVSNIIDNKKPLIVNEIKYSEMNTPSDSVNIIKNQIIGNEYNEQLNKKEITTPKESTLLDQLVDCNTASELQSLLKKGEILNSLIFNWNSKTYMKNNSSVNFYIVLINPENNKIVSFLDKGKTERNDLKNNKIVKFEVEQQKMIQVWIQFL
jgi:hypothetical protein